MIDRNYKEIGNTMFCCLIFTVCGWLGSLSVGSVSAINATQTLIGTETSGMCGLFAKRIHSLSTRNARNTHNALQMQLTKKIKIEHILKNILHTIDYLKLNNVDIDNPSEYLKFIIDEVNKLSTSRDKFKELIHIGLILFDYNNSLVQNRLNHVNNPSKLLNFISAANDYLSIATAKEIANAQAVVDESADRDDIAGAKQVLEKAESKKAVALRQLMHLGLTLQEYEWQHGLFELIEKFNEISSSEIVNFIFKLIQNGNNKPIVNNNPFGKSVIEAISPFLDSWRMPNIHTEPWTQFKIDFESHLEIRSQHMERD